MRWTPSFLATVLLCLFLGACGSLLTGHSYHNNGGVIQVEFKSGGKAYVSDGRISRTCNYSESGRVVRLVCEHDTFDLTIQDDGALIGPANGLMARLTPVLN